MENNYLILNPTPDLIIPEDACQLVDNKAISSHTMVHIQGIRREQQVRLAGKPYTAYDDVDYFLAISG
jgi:adenylate cyclase